VKFDEALDDNEAQTEAETALGCVRLAKWDKQRGKEFRGYADS